MPELSHTLIWIVAGLVLMLLEMFVPGVFLIWLGIAALATGLVLQFVSANFAFEVILFAAFAAIAVTTSLRFRPQRPTIQVNTPASGLVGREAVALEFHGRIGRVRVGDSEWSARLAGGAPQPEPQASLRVVGVDGTTVIVAPP
jgi:membrane protein implicated in regulation of membrane protease activity